MRKNKNKIDQDIKEIKNEINKGLLRILNELGGGKIQQKQYPYKVPELFPGIVPKGRKAPVMAMDNVCYSDYFADMFGFCLFSGFPGYPYLSQLATKAEYRKFAEVNAMELTREWIKIVSHGESDEAAKEKISIIENKLIEIDLRNAIRLAGEHVELFGKAQIFIDIEGDNIINPLIMSPRTIKKGSLKGVKAVEPIWTTPSTYNAINPAAPDFYKPTKWFMLGVEVHASRLLTIITRDLPDMLKPAFNFGGISLSQLAEPYVDNWLKIRQAVSDLVTNFSILFLKTDMQQLLSATSNCDAVAQNILNRVKMFIATRNNQGLMVLDKDIEDLGQVAVPLSGLPELQSQALENLCSVSGIPEVKLLGVSPAGFNATSDGETRAFYDKKSAEQEAYWRKPINTIIKLIMLSELGEIDDTIGFVFNPLWQMDEKEEAEIKNLNAQANQTYINSGVLSNVEVRNMLIRDEDSGYNGLEIIEEEDDPDLGIANMAEEDDRGG